MNAVMNGVMKRGNAGQATVEYTMMLGLLTAIIVALTQMIVPAFGKVIVGFVQHVAIYISSV
jgi:Flp pilus assembly pilin Flp